LFAYLGDYLNGILNEDCGCGPGQVTEKLLGRGVGRVDAIHQNATMLRQLEARAHQAVQEGRGKPSEQPRIALVQLYQKDENTLTIRLAPEGRFKRGDKWHGDMMEGEKFDFHFYSSIFLTRKGLLNLFNHFNVRRGYSAQAQPISA
jgi:SAM-dependent methyltransferase